MADMPELPHINIAHQLERTISAHEAVHEGIATHAEKERARAHAAHAAAEAARRVTGGLTGNEPVLRLVRDQRGPGRPGTVEGCRLCLPVAACLCYCGHAGYLSGRGRACGHRYPHCHTRKEVTHMTDQQTAVTAAGIGCSFGCGNTSNFILIDIESSDTSFLCVPCFLFVAGNLTEAMINPSNPDVVRALADNPPPEQPKITLPGRAVATLLTGSNGQFKVCADCGTPEDQPHEVGCSFAASFE